MNIESIFLSILAILTIIGILRLVEWQVVKVFGVSQNTSTDVYQGGEVLIARDRGYKIEKYNLSIFFLIFHVLGFFTATLYILPHQGYQLVNGMTVVFGLFIFYIVMMIRQGIR